MIGMIAFIVLRASYHSNVLASSLKILEQASSREISILLGRGNIVHLGDELLGLTTSSPILDIVITDTNKNVVTSASNKITGDNVCCDESNAYPWQPSLIEKYLMWRAPALLYETFVFKGNQELVIVSMPIFEYSSRVEIGRMHALIDRSSAFIGSSKSYYYLSIILTLATFFTGLFASVAVAASLANPIEDVAREISSIDFKHGETHHYPNLNNFVRQTPVEELSHLVGAINDAFSILSRKNDEIAKLRASSAIAQMTSMLAHDVRKPFSMLQIAIDMLRETTDPAEMKSIIDEFVPELERARSSVDGLIADVMEVGSTSTQLIQEPVSIESLVESSLGEIFRVYPDADISIGYQLSHQHMVNVHVQKIGRVLSNIIGNAIQAISYKGKIWVKTSEANGFVTVCLGNAGSFIPQESLGQLFEAFFTSGKKGGTGLGLAIAQKVVNAHGGRIWCESVKSAEFPDGKVEFFFTLPVAAGVKSQTTAALPSHSSEISKAIRALTERSRSQSGSQDQGEARLESDIIKVTKAEGRKLRILVIDDEAVYRRGIASMLSHSDELKDCLTITEADGSSKALADIEGSVKDQKPFDLMITDIDMGPASLSGFDLVAKVRALVGPKLLISVHSNRIVADDQKRALTAGADSFIPKPVARAQLLKLVLQAVMMKPDSKQKPAPTEPAALNRPKIAVIEDGLIILKRWEKTLSPDCDVKGFEFPAEFWQYCSSNPDYLGSLTAVITDQNFDGVTTKGLDLAAELKEKRPELTIMLASSGEFTQEQLTGKIDHVIDKRPAPLAKLPVRNS
jgi:signal transduction histidine kinase/CheY-like chemotaxis protein